MRKTVLTGIGAAIAVLVGVLCVNTYYGHPQPGDVAAIPQLHIDEQASAGKLAQALQAITVSEVRNKDANAGEFVKLHKLLESHFPLVHSNLKREAVGNGFALLYTWQGSDPAAAPVMWMAHQDVVPVAPGTEKDWKHSPFGGAVADGFIWGRGAWDDKGNLYAQLEAIEMLLANGFRPKQTIYLAYGADEEIGGTRGASLIAAELKRRGVRLGYVIDEGLMIMDGIVPGLSKPAALIGVAEKGFATFRLEVSTPPGHSSMPPSRTAIGMLSEALSKLEDGQMPSHSDGLAQQLFETLAPEIGGFNRVVLSNFWLFRPMLERKLEQIPSMNAMLRTTTAPTLVSAGIKDNVLPGYASASLNFRLLPGDTIEDVKQHIENTISNKAIRVSLSPDFSVEASPVSSIQSVQYATLGKTIQQIFPNVVVAPGLMVAGTDSRYMHQLSGSVFKFTPLQAKPDDLARFHGTNERISVKAYADMIRFYHQLAMTAN